SGGGAETAKIHAGDRILAVDSTQLGDVSVSEASKLIQGDEGTKVTLLLTDEKGVRREVEVLRGKVQLASVEDIQMIAETGYLRIDQFTLRTGKEFDSAMTFLNESGMRFLVVDLRDNGGGLLKAAVDVLSHFFEKDEVVVSIQGRGRPGGVVYQSSGKNSIRCPVVVLINARSASASEIVAGALQVSGKAQLVGESSYGKGSVQTIFTLNDESGIRLTTARYFLPGRIAIGADGLSPDIEVECEDETWRKILLQRGQAPFADAATFEYRFGFQPVGDPQLEMALCILRSTDDFRLQETKGRPDDLPNP
ncbi:MAG: S41 family peptidase, partial [Opitutales bacterium]